MNGIERIAKERQRQIDEECWDSEHDDDYKSNELLSAAQAYLLYAISPSTYNQHGHGNKRPLLPMCWPWLAGWWKPSPDPIRNLEKAGALIAAEIDRLERVRENLTEPGNES